jgi:hypothetical protein
MRFAWMESLQPNRASGQRALGQRQWGSGSVVGTSGACAECGNDERVLQTTIDASRMAMSTSVAADFSQVAPRTKGGALETKLTMNAPGDAYEQEADRIADRLAESPAGPTLRNAPPNIQRVSAQSRGEPEQAPPSVDHALNSPGRALDPPVRQEMENRFGRDFSYVRVHTDATAARSARDVSANAYTVGSDIVFGTGRFAPTTREGRRLLAHELTHVVQQSGAARTANSAGAQHMLQRDMGFEFQTKNFVIGEKGRKFPRKFGNFLHKVPVTDKHGVEFQTDTGSVVEFETYHFRKWSDLRTQISNAVAIVQEIKKDPKAFPFNQAKRLESEKLLKKGEKLEVDVKDPTFTAAIQSTEGFALAQYGSALREHERTGFVDPPIKGAQRIIAAAQKAGKTRAATNVDNLRGFLEVILNYILNGQDRPSRAGYVSPVKARFRLMSRTNFSAMYSTILSKDEQALFRQIVKSDAIPQELGLAATDAFFPDGYWGHVGDLWALFQGGKVVALASEDKRTIHDCSQKTKTPGIDASKCGTKARDTEITIAEWLNSIIKQKRDVLSPPPRGGSESMGKFDVRSTGGEKGLVVFETRGETHRNRNQPADKWVDYAEDVFREAAACRARPGSGTEVIYDGTKPFDPKKCP